MNTACVIIFLNLKQKSGLSSVLVWIEGKVSLDPFFKVNNFPALPMYRFNYHSYIVDIMQQTKDFFRKKEKKQVFQTCLIQGAWRKYACWYGPGLNMTI